MSDTVAEFVAQNGYGPFALLALPMIAILVRSQAGEDGAKVMALVLFGVMGLTGILLKDFYLGFLNQALMDQDYRPSGRNFLPGSNLVGERKEPWFPWQVAAPLALAITFAVLLPARSRILPMVYCFGLVIYGQTDRESREVVGEGTLSYIRAEAHDAAAQAQAFFDWARDKVEGEPDG
ncbi:MAG: hypothetical protein AAF160_07830 [Pseudomonadota bacterium]